MKNVQDIYNKIQKDSELSTIYEDINNKINFCIDHGELHIQHVTNYVNKICALLSIDDETKYLALISALLHDTGRLTSRENHSLYSREFAENYLKNKLSKKQLDMVCEAIFLHDHETFDYNTNNNAAWILFLADKLDYTRSRYISALTKEEHKTKFSYNIEKFEFKLEKNIVNIIVTIFEKSASFEETFNSRLADVYHKVFAHFNKDVKTTFKQVK